MTEKKDDKKPVVPMAPLSAPGSVSEPALPEDQVKKTTGTKKYDGGPIPRRSRK